MLRMPNALVLVLLMVCLSATATYAETITVSTPDGALVGPSNVPVRAVATILTADDSVVVTLTNLLENPVTVNQNLTDLGFVLSTRQTVGSLSSSSARERTVFDGGTYTDGVVVPTGWDIETFSFPFGEGLRLHLLGTSTPPPHSLIGDPNPGTNKYDAANHSITGDPHNPFLSGSATFTLNVPGVSADSKITGVRFSFNTSEDSFADIVVVPEPASLPLIAGALALLGIGRRLSRSS